MPNREMAKRLGVAVPTLILVSLACSAPDPSPTLAPATATVPFTVVAPTATLEPTDTPPPIEPSGPTAAPTWVETPPPSPTPTHTPPAQQTSTPSPTPVATPNPAEFRGLVPSAYWVEGAPGPFEVDEEIWFNIDITNSSGGTVAYQALGTWVEETGQFQKSWSYSAFSPGQHFMWRDHIHIPAPGTYHLWLAIQFDDGAGVKLRGPITVTVQ